MLSMGGSCAGSPEAKVLVAFFVLLFEGQRSFGMTFTVMVWAGRVLVMLDSLLFVKIHVARIDIWVRGDGLQWHLMGRRWCPMAIALEGPRQLNGGHLALPVAAFHSSCILTCPYESPFNRGVCVSSL